MGQKVDDVLEKYFAPGKGKDERAPVKLAPVSSSRIVQNVWIGEYFTCFSVMTLNKNHCCPRPPPFPLFDGGVFAPKFV